jgi:16S rRNA (uracil1498-N3)-methyltransferase
VALHFLLDDSATVCVDEGGRALPGGVRDAGPGDVVTLTGAEAHHAAVVRRVRVGEEVTVGDGRGVWLTGACIAVGTKAVEVQIAARRDIPAPSPRVVLVQALAKGDRDELAVQAATELGVDEIVPWQAARSVSRWAHSSRGGRGEDAARVAKGRTRWATIAREAAKQAHRAWVPDIGELATTSALAARAVDARVVVLEPSGAVRLTGIRFEPDDERDIVLVVGPEGGIAPEELAALAAAGAQVAVLGDTVLRTSTAGPAALAVVSAALGRW